MVTTRTTLAGLVVVGALAAGCEHPGPEAVDENAWGLPLTAVTGTATSPHGTVVGGVSTEAELFWDAWVVPFDGGPPRRLAPVGNNLVAVDAAGAVWTAITDFDASGRTAYEVRLSPSDGAPSVALSTALPSNFSAERAVADGEGGWLLAGSEERGGATRGSVFAVDANGRAARVASDLGPSAPLYLSATLAADGLYLGVQYASDGPSSIVKVPRR